MKSKSTVSLVTFLCCFTNNDSLWQNGNKNIRYGTVCFVVCKFQNRTLFYVKKILQMFFL